MNTSNVISIYANNTVQGNIESQTKDINYINELFMRYNGKTEDFDNALSVIRNEKVVPGASEVYVQIKTIDVLISLLDKGINFKWDLDMLERPCFKDVPKNVITLNEDDYRFAGKHRVVVFPEIEGTDVSELEDKLAFALYIYNSSDRSMRFGMFAGWLVWLCMNGCFSGEAVKTEDGEDAFFRQRHSYFNEEELAEDIDKIAVAVKNYIDDKKYSSMMSQLNLLTKTPISKNAEYWIAKKVMILRIKQQSWYTAKFEAEGNSIRITPQQVENFMKSVYECSLPGQRGNDYHDTMQRYQYGAGLNPHTESRSAHVPNRLEFDKVLVDKVSGKKSYKTCKLTKLQLRNQEAIQQVNSEFTNFVFNVFRVSSI